jgi:hypothetical protein
MDQPNRQKEMPLFIPNDDNQISLDNEGFDELDDLAMTSTLKSIPTSLESSQNTANRKRKALLPILDDESDDGTFKGFITRKKNRY